MENTEEKVSWILKWFGKYERKDRKAMKNNLQCGNIYNSIGKYQEMSNFSGIST
jgi:hypothetical protein